MEARTFKTIISIPSKVCIDKECEMVTIPTAKGYIGILANHAPIVSAIRPGYITLKYSDGTKQVGLVNYGLLKFSDNHLTILSDLFEFSCHGVDSNALVEVQERIAKAAAKVQMNEKTATALNSYMRAITSTAKKNTKK